MKWDSHLLRRAARVWGVQPSYRDTTGGVTWSKEKNIAEILQYLTGTVIESNSDLESLIERKHTQNFQRGIEPVLVAWGHKLRRFKIQLERASEVPAAMQMQFRFAEVPEVVAEDFTYPVKVKKARRGPRGLSLTAEVEGEIPLGYFAATLVAGRQRFQSFVISAPEKLAAADGHQSWGPFLPLYALRSQSDWGCGSLAELKMAGQQVALSGAKWIGTMPLLAGRLDTADCDPSPYSALTRLFWNELYLDVDALIQRYDANDSRKLTQSIEFRQRLASLRERDFVDYHGVYQLKNEILKPLAQQFFGRGLAQQAEYLKFAQDNPEIEAYAKFRSADQEMQNYHRFVQFEMNRALSEISTQSPVGLYLDFPVGVNDSGFDFKHFRDVFFSEVSVGAPPEPVFAKGQDWGFPSFHPDRHRESNYLYLRKSLANHLRYSRILRLDHVMGLFRVYCVVKGRPASEGVYLRFPPEEMFAVALLETHRAGADLIGENLGTVPAAVDQLLDDRNIKRMWVWQMAKPDEADHVAEAVPTTALACVNTHDMPMLQDFENGDDLPRVRDLGILSGETAAKFKVDRDRDMSQWHNTFGEAPLGQNFYSWLARVPAKYVLLTVEDLWRERAPQNIPGTWKEYPNWRRKFRVPIEEWREVPLLKSTFDRFAAARG